MAPLPLRVYADTSVFGGVFDPECATASQAFFDQVRTGTFTLVTSAIVAAEMQAAPPAVQTFFSTTLGLATITPTNRMRWFCKTPICGQVWLPRNG